MAVPSKGTPIAVKIMANVMIPALGTAAAPMDDKIAINIIMNKLVTDNGTP